MAIAAPARRSDLQTAPGPARTSPPEPKKRPRDRPRPGGRGRSSAEPTPTATPAPTALKRGKASPGKRRVAPSTKKAPSARAATATPVRKPARKGSGPTKAPARRKPPARRRAGVIPIAAGHAGRAAVAVSQLPESGLIHRLTRGRAWIGVLGVLLVGIVALNVVTLSFAASSGKVDEKIQELSKENSMLQSRKAEHYGQAQLLHEAGKLGLKMGADGAPKPIFTHRDDVANAAKRLAAMAGATAGAAAAEGGEGAAAGESASGEGSATAEGAASGGESEFTPEELAIYEKEWAELQAEEAGDAPVEETVTEVPTE